MLNLFPKITINPKRNTESQHLQSFFLKKGFITKNKEIFLPMKERNFSEAKLQLGKKKNNGYILEIIFHGLNYSAKRIKLYRKSFLVDVHKSEIFICKEPLTTEVKSRIYKRRLVFFSYKKSEIKYMEKYLKEFKKPNSYTGKGIFSRNDNYHTKKAKKRK